MDPPKLRIYQGHHPTPAEELRNIKARIEEKYAEKIKTAGSLRRAFYRMIMRHELETELEKYAQTLAGRL